LAYEPTIDDLRQLPPEGRKLWSLRDNFSVVNNVLIFKLADNSQLIVPDVLKRRLFEQAHAGPLSAHLGSERTLAQLRDSYY